MSSRFYYHLRDPLAHGTLSLALLPRIRLTVGTSIGIGFQWMSAWFHVWLRTSNASRTKMIELLPHVWFHWNRKWGYGVHLWWLTWKGHVWLHQKSEQAEDGTL